MRYECLQTSSRGKARLVDVIPESVSTEILNLIDDLGLVPLNYWASDFYQIVELDELKRNRIECDLRRWQIRNHTRKYVPPPESDCLPTATQQKLF